MIDASFQGLPSVVQDEALIDVQTVLALTGFKSTTPIYTRVREGTFPPPIRLSSRCSRWKLRAVRDWVAKQGQQIAEAA